MGNLTIGRVGLDVPLSDPAEWQDTASFDGWITRVSGYLMATSAATAKALRSELLEQQGVVVAVTYTLDPSMNGFYILESANVNTILSSFRVGLFPFSVSMQRIGSEGATEFQSLMTGETRVNAHGLVSAEVNSIHAPARNHVSYNIDGGAAVQTTRSTEDGNLNVYTGLGYLADPTWSVAPTDFYSAGAYIKSGGRLRSGLDMGNATLDFETGNKLFKITPSLTTGANDGRIDMQWWVSGAYNGPFSFEFYLDTNRIPEWHYTSIICNTPEVCRLRLVRDAEDPNSIYRHTLDIEVRRGLAFASFYYSYNDGVNHFFQAKLEGDSTAMTSITPAGASNAVARQVADQSWLIGSSQSVVTNTIGGGTRVNTTPADIFIGFEINNTGINTAESMCLEYHAPLSVWERTVRR